MERRATLTRLPRGALPGRQAWVLVHRWAGLTITLFLVVAGLTGAVLPFEEELTLLSRADLAAARPPAPGARPLDPVTLAERVERATGGVVAAVPLAVPASHVSRLFVAARPGHAPLAYDVAWADPYTGAVRLRYRWGGLGDGRVDVVPFLFSLHYGVVAGPWGSFAFGLAALVWTLDCFVGFGLTLPLLPRPGARVLAGGRARARPWLARWAPAWRVRFAAGGHRRTYDLHRAGGLWLWPLLLAFAWSSVGLLLPAVERPVMAMLGAHPAFAPPPLPAPVATPPVGRRAAVALGLGELARRGRRDGFAVLGPTVLVYLPAAASYRLDARTTLDRGASVGATAVWIDARRGRPIAFERPFGTGAADGARHLFLLLHFAELFGLPYRLLVSATGLAVALLAATGVLIWTRKRSARLLAGARRRRRRPEPPGPGERAAA